MLNFMRIEKYVNYLSRTPIVRIPLVDLIVDTRKAPSVGQTCPAISKPSGRAADKAERVAVQLGLIAEGRKQG